jgi:hypothetical protein
VKKKKQNMRGIHRYQAKRMRTEACEDMLLNMPVKSIINTLSKASLIMK